MTGEVSTSLDDWFRAEPVERCANCKRRPQWTEIEVERAGGLRIPEEDFTYADCRCGYRYEIHPVIEGEAA